MIKMFTATDHTAGSDIKRLRSWGEGKNQENHENQVNQENHQNQVNQENHENQVNQVNQENHENQVNQENHENHENQKNHENQENQENHENQENQGNHENQRTTENHTITVTQCYIYAKSDSKRLVTSAVAITPEISLIRLMVLDNKLTRAQIIQDVTEVGSTSINKIRSILSRFCVKSTWKHGVQHGTCYKEQKHISP